MCETKTCLCLWLYRDPLLGLVVGCKLVVAAAGRIEWSENVRVCLLRPALQYTEDVQETRGAESSG